MDERMQFVARRLAGEAMADPERIELASQGVLWRGLHQTF